MPRRSNRFQRLITLINGVLGTDAHVVESAMLPDKITGELREVDIVISTNVSGYEVNRAIEVAGRRRRADTPWVECMHSKHSFEIEDRPLHSNGALSPHPFDGAIPRAATHSFPKCGPCLGG